MHLRASSEQTGVYVRSRYARASVGKWPGGARGVATFYVKVSQRRIHAYEMLQLAEGYGKVADGETRCYE